MPERKDIKPHCVYLDDLEFKTNLKILRWPAVMKFEMFLPVSKNMNTAEQFFIMGIDVGFTLDFTVYLH